MKTLSESYKNRLQELAGINEYSFHIKDYYLPLIIEGKEVGGVYIDDKSDSYPHINWFKDKKIFNLHDLNIKLEYQGKGYGYTLLKNAFKYCKDKNGDFVVLSVLRNNKRAINLYKKIGFKLLDNTNYDFQEFSYDLNNN